MSQARSSKSTAREMAEEVWAGSTRAEKIQTVVWFSFICAATVGAVVVTVLSMVFAATGATQ